MNSNLQLQSLALSAHSESRIKTQSIFIPRIQKNSLIHQKSISQIFNCSVNSDERIPITQVTVFYLLFQVFSMNSQYQG